MKGHSGLVCPIDGMASNNMPKNRMSCEYEGCTRTYCSSFNLKRHIESTHFGVKKFKCPTCSRFLSSKQNLIDHQNIHTGAKPYRCEIPGCGMYFRQLSQYYLHKQLHIEVSNHIVQSYNTHHFKLDFFMEKLSKECENRSYNIPNSPYNITDSILPCIQTMPDSTVHLPSFTCCESLITRI